MDTDSSSTSIFHGAVLAIFVGLVLYLAFRAGHPASPVMPGVAGLPPAYVAPKPVETPAAQAAVTAPATPEVAPAAPTENGGDWK